MSTWLNGLGIGRPRKKDIHTQPALEVVNRAIEKSAVETRESKERGFASATIGAFLQLWQDYGFHSGRSHRRYRPAVRVRGAGAITTEVRDFFRQRPRPWLSPNLRARLQRKARARRQRPW